MTAALACQKTSQHQTSTTLFRACGWDRETSPLSRSPVCSPTSTPKPRAEGRVRAGGTQATSRPSRQARQVRPSISTMLWWRPPPFPCSIASFPIRPHPSSTSPTLSSTQNAPGFALFGGGPGAVLCFCPFLPAKFAGRFLFTVPICLTD